MEKRLELRLAKILRHVHLNESVDLNTLASKMSKAQGIPVNEAFSSIWELIDRGYLMKNDDETLVRGGTPYPPEITPGGYYRFTSECWVCGESIFRDLDIYTSRIHWECSDCQVKWTEDVME